MRESNLKKTVVDNIKVTDVWTTSGEKVINTSKCYIKSRKSVLVTRFYLPN